MMRWVEVLENPCNLKVPLSDCTDSVCETCDCRPRSDDERLVNMYNEFTTFKLHGINIVKAM